MKHVVLFLSVMALIAGVERAGAQTFTHVESLFDGVGGVDGFESGPQQLATAERA